MKCLILIGLALLGASCSGLPTGGGVFDGNPATRPTPGFTELEIRPATSTTSAPAGQNLKNISVELGAVQIDEVRLVYRDLQLLEDPLVALFNLEGPFVVRLIQGGNIMDQAHPPFGGAVVPNGSYSQFDLGYELLNASQIPADLLGDMVTQQLVNHSIVIEGKFQGPNIPPINGVFIPFTFISSQVSDLRIETPNPFSLQGDYTTLFIAFKVETWFDDSILTSLLALPLSLLSTPPVILDTTSLNPLLKGIALLLEANINTSLRFAPSVDNIFQESDVDEQSFSQVLP